MSKHTPGPWSIMWQQVREHPYGGGPGFRAPVCVGNEKNQGNCLAIVHMGGKGALNSDRNSIVANANLIAAAPDMYEALKAYQAVVDHTKACSECGEMGVCGVCAELQYTSLRLTEEALIRAERKGECQI